MFTRHTFCRHRGPAVSFCAAILLAACGGGGGGTGGDVAVGNDPVDGKCTPGVLSGFAGGFDDTPVKVRSVDNLNEGAIGDAGEGAGGIGIGGSLGQFTNVDVEVEFASGERFGPKRVDAEKGMVTVVPCALQAPALVTFKGAAGSGATYFDESLKRKVSFEGKELRTVITSFTQNAGVTSFTEAMVKRVERLASNGGAAAGDGWKDAQRVETGHTEVKALVNQQLPGSLRLDDLRRLPVIVNEQNFTAGSGVLTDTQNGIYGATIAGFVQTGGAAIGTGTDSPALEISRQFSTDAADGRLDRLDDGRPVAENVAAAYTLDSLWSNQTLQSTQSANLAGAGSLTSLVMPLDSTQISMEAGGSQLLALTTTHFSDGTLRYELGGALAQTVCQGRNTVFEFQNVRQKNKLSAFSQDGRTIYTLQLTNDPCAPNFALPANSADIVTAWMDPAGIYVRTTDGRFFFYADQVWYPLSIDGPRHVQILETRGGIGWGISFDGRLYRHPLGSGLRIPDASTGGARTPPGSALLVPLPDPVINIATSDDEREVFALTAAHKVYWIDVRDASGARSLSVQPQVVELPLGEVCSISAGLIAVACDGQSHRTVRAVTDLNAPPALVQTLPGPFGPVTVVTPGISGVSWSAPVPAVTPIWRSTHQFVQAEGTQTSGNSPGVFAVNSPGRLLGIDGSIRALDGTEINVVR
ncbi:MAG: hypothetical protein KDK91_34035 [Gammaproteobacteria bacterium]|nr:hypothetical protein [Gammaproteobacteria bacterium]